MAATTLSTETWWRTAVAAGPSTGDTSILGIGMNRLYQPFIKSTRTKDSAEPSRVEEKIAGLEPLPIHAYFTSISSLPSSLSSTPLPPTSMSSLSVLLTHHRHRNPSSSPRRHCNVMVFSPMTETPVDDSDGSTYVCVQCMHIYMHACAAFVHSVAHCQAAGPTVPRVHTVPANLGRASPIAGPTVASLLNKEEVLDLGDDLVHEGLDNFFEVNDVVAEAGGLGGVPQRHGRLEATSAWASRRSTGMKQHAECGLAAKSSVLTDVEWTYLRRPSYQPSPATLATWRRVVAGAHMAVAGLRRCLPHSPLSPWAPHVCDTATAPPFRPRLPPEAGAERERGRWHVLLLVSSRLRLFPGWTCPLSTPPPPPLDVAAAAAADDDDAAGPQIWTLCAPPWSSSPPVSGPAALQSW
uniref:Uncharacterized protein n=1 Tax=Oryza punctata TaxID=4537 RepID=A0A0E0M8A1_ORYPU